MSYRGVVKDGVVVLDRGAGLPDGTAVEVTPVERGMTSLRELSAFGLWRDRQDLGNSGDASRELRASVERRQADG